jgi:hypothetical protein
MFYALQIRRTIVGAVLLERLLPTLLLWEAVCVWWSSWWRQVLTCAYMTTRVDLWPTAAPRIRWLTSLNTHDDMLKLTGRGTRPLSCGYQWLSIYYFFLMWYSPRNRSLDISKWEKKENQIIGWIKGKWSKKAAKKTAVINTGFGLVRVYIAACPSMELHKFALCVLSDASKCWRSLRSTRLPAFGSWRSVRSGCWRMFVWKWTALHHAEVADIMNTFSDCKAAVSVWCGIQPKWLSVRVKGEGLLISSFRIMTC